MEQERIQPDTLARVSIDRREREAGYIMPRHHCHSYYELVYLERGSCRFLIEDRMYDLPEDSFLLIPPNLFHYTHYPFGSCFRSGVYFRLSDLSSELTGLFPEGEGFFGRVQFFRATELSRRPISTILAAMEDEERLADKSSSLMLRVQLHELLLLCSRVCSFSEDMPTDIYTTNRQILQAAHFINEHFRQQITAADIATAAGFSPNYLSRKFREAAGIGVHEYLIFIRLRNAASELLSTDSSVTEIALRCGFSDSNYFKDAFKKKYGMPPRMYRKTHSMDYRSLSQR